MFFLSYLPGHSVSGIKTFPRWAQVVTNSGMKVNQVCWMENDWQCLNNELFILKPQTPR